MTGSHPVAETPLPCPICARSIRRPQRAKPLFGFKVCRKCRNGFANRRQAAFLVDWVVLLTIPGALIGSLAARYLPTPPGTSPPPTLLITILGLQSPVGFFVAWILPFLFYCKDAHGGRSPGKWLTGLRVVDRDTREPIGLMQSLKRNLVFLIPFSVLIGVATMMKGPRWGDGWAKTVVIWDRYRYKPPFDPRGLLCTGCGYNLTGNTSGRCPECFTPIPSGVRTDDPKLGETCELQSQD